MMEPHAVSNIVNPLFFAIYVRIVYTSETLFTLTERRLNSIPRRRWDHHLLGRDHLKHRIVWDFSVCESAIVTLKLDPHIVSFECRKIEPRIGPGRASAGKLTQPASMFASVCVRISSPLSRPQLCAVAWQKMTKSRRRVMNRKSLASNTWVLGECLAAHT